MRATIDLEQLEQLYRDGKTHKEIADVFNVSSPTVNRYLHKVNVKWRGKGKGVRKPRGKYRVKESPDNTGDTLGNGE